MNQVGLGCLFILEKMLGEADHPWSLTLTIPRPKPSSPLSISPVCRLRDMNLVLARSRSARFRDCQGSAKPLMHT